MLAFFGGPAALVADGVTLYAFLRGIHKSGGRMSPFLRRIGKPGGSIHAFLLWYP